MSVVAETGVTPFPYPGLRPFRQEEADIFFGRDQHVDDLLGKLKNRRFLAVIGPSGCGKSSLVRAGMIPAMESGFMGGAGFQWSVAKMRPGNQPVRNLAQSLLESGVFGSQWQNNDEDLDHLVSLLNRGPSGLVELMRMTESAGDENLLLLVDQFEEIFRFEKRGDPTEARAFVELLLATIRAEDVPVYVTITMRSDFLGNCPLFAGLPEAMNDSQYLTPRLSREQTKASIIGPASMFDGKIDPEVVNQILNEMGTDPDQLPLMQHLLMRMWRRAERRTRTGTTTGTVNTAYEVAPANKDVHLTLDDYETAGGLAHALSDHADKVFERRLEDDEQRRIAEFMFRRLTEVTADGQTIRRGADLQEICDAANAYRDEVADVVNKFRIEGRSFLTPSTKEVRKLAKDTLVDISHESLIRQWDHLREWTEDEDRSKRVYAMVTKEAAEWKTHGKRDQHLLTGARLEEALEWAAKTYDVNISVRTIGQILTWSDTADADADVRDFLKTSQNERDRKVRLEEAVKYNRLRLWSVAIGGLLLATIVALFIGSALVRQREVAKLKDTEKNTAQKSHRKEVALRLVQAAQEVSESQLKLLLAAESIQMTRRHAESDKEAPVEGAHEVLEAALHRFHHSGIKSVAFAGAYQPITSIATVTVGSGVKNQILLSGSEDGIFYLTDLSTEETTALEPDDDKKAPLTIVAFDRASFDGDHPRWVVTGDKHGVVRLWNFENPDPKKVFKLHNELSKGGENVIGNAVTDLEFSRDRRWLVVGWENGSVKIWRCTKAATSPQELVFRDRDRLKHKGQITDLAFSRDNKWLVSGSRDKNAHLWPLDANPNAANPFKDVSAIELRGHADTVNDVALSRDGLWLATCSDDTTVRLWSITAKEINRPVILKGNGRAVKAISFGPKNRWLVSGSENGILHFWDMKSPDPAVGSISMAAAGAIPVNSPVRNITFSGDGSWLVTVLDDRRVFLRHLTENGPSRRPITLDGHDARVVQARFVAGGRNETETWLLTASEDGVVRKWDITGENSVFARQDEQEFNLTEFNRDQRWFVEGSKDGTIHIWDLQSEDPLKQRFIYKSSTSRVSALKFTGDQQFVVGHEDSSLYWFDLTKMNFEDEDDHQSVTKGIAKQLAGHDGAIRSIAVSADGDRMVTGADDRKAHVWELKNDGPVKLVTPDMEHEGPVQSAALSSRTDRLVTLSTGIARLWDISSESPDFAKFNAPYKVSGQLQITQDNWLIAGGPSTLWNLAARNPTSNNIELKGQTSPVFGVSSKDRWLVTPHAGQLCFWDLTAPDPSITKFCLPTYQTGGFISNVTNINFSPDDKWFTAAHDDNTVYLWKLDFDDGKPAPRLLQRLAGHEDRISSISFGSNRLLTASLDATVRRWKLIDHSSSLPDLVELAEKTSGRNLSHDEWDRYVKTEVYYPTFDLDPHRSVFEPTEAERGIVQASPKRIEELVGKHKNYLANLASKSEDEQKNIGDYRAKLKQASLLATVRKKRFDAIREAKEDNRNEAIEFLTDHYRLARDEKSKSDIARQVDEWRIEGLLEQTRTAAEFKSAEKAADAFRRAEKAFQAARKLSRQLSSQHQHANIDPTKDAANLIADSLMRLGERNVHKQAIPKAEDCFVKAFEFKRKAGVDVPMEDAKEYTKRVAANSYVEKGWQFIESGQGQQAIKSFDLAIELSDSVEINRKAAATKLILFGTRFAQKTPVEMADTKADELTRVLNAAKKLNPELNWKDPQVKAQQFVADALLSSVHRMVGRDSRYTDQVLQDTFDKAKEFDPSLKFIKDRETYFKRITARLLIRRATRLLATGDYRKKAIALFDKAIALDKSEEGTATLDFQPQQLAELLAGITLLNLAKHAAFDGDRLESIDMFRLASELLAKVKEIYPNDQQFKFDPKLEVAKYVKQPTASSGYNPVEIFEANQELVLARAQRLAQVGKIETAMDECKILRTFDPLTVIPPQFWNDICWYGTIEGKAKEVLFAGNIAIAFRPDDGNFHDTRGVALALSGKPNEAIKDFEAYLWWTRLHERREERQQWIRDLKAGKAATDIFTEEVFERLKTQ